MNAGVSRPLVDKNYEDFDLRAADNATEYRVSNEDTDKALRDLMADAGNSIITEIDMSEAIVPGFRDGVVLLPHQVISRTWMAERESGKRTGGMLGDDMGCVQSGLDTMITDWIVYVVSARLFRPSLV